jgi:hypothetical protein
VGRELAETMRALCKQDKVAFKEESKWGVSDESDRLTEKKFGDFKSEFRSETEAKLHAYMCEPSPTRGAGDTSGQGETEFDFKVAVTVAAPGTGKSRMLDDAVRVHLDSRHFDHFLRFAITFNGKASGVYNFPFSARILGKFFCVAAPGVDMSTFLEVVDKMLSSRFAGENDVGVAPKVLGAIEALFFQQHGGKLGRTVLMVDEISKVGFAPLAATLQSVNEIASTDGKLFPHWQEALAYRIVTKIVDNAPLSAQFGRRGVVMTALSYVKPWALSGSGRVLEWLPLGTFDVWSAGAQEAITGEARALDMLSNKQDVNKRVWSLLAATGGRPRDVRQVLLALQGQTPRVALWNPIHSRLMSAFYAPSASSDPIFESFLLTSLLGVEFNLFFTDTDEKLHLTQFGVHAVNPQLLNADQFASKIQSAVPTVSLRFAGSVSHAASRDTVTALIEATAFCALDGSGKDFKQVWVLLVFAHLCLQHNVRVNAASSLWPQCSPGVAQLGGPARPTALLIDVFSQGNRVEALFARPAKARIHKPSALNRKIEFDEGQEPTLAIWDNLWVPSVLPGALVPGWSMATHDVVWRPSTVVFFSKSNMAAIDFMLLVGDANGTGDAQPHVYMFQCKPLADPTQGTESRKAVTVSSIVSGVQEKLTTLFTAEFAGHVLRRAGISSVDQVTLCINALQFGPRVDASELTGPLSVVLFDESDFRALGGAAFANTWFFRYIAQFSRHE